MFDGDAGSHNGCAMRNRWLLLGIGALGLAVLAWAQSGANLAIVINGQAVSGKTAVVKGQTYVPLSALKAAGFKATIASGKLTLSSAPAGGANQVTALEGGMNDWLFNGIWRLRVTSVKPNDDGRPGWKVGIELRNGTKLDNVAPGGTGLDSVSLIMEDGNAIKPYNITDFADKGLGQGATNAMDLLFYDDDGGGRKPNRLVVRIVPDDFTKNFLKNQGAGYTVADPSFRVRLTVP